MDNAKYLNPAYDVIMRFGDGRLSNAIELVASITKRSQSRVYLWMRPEEKGGTGGYIPRDPQLELMEYAKKKKMRLSADDFFSAAKAA